MAQTEQPVVNTQPPKASMTRRKLVRGAFALPAVATVHSGSALATSSSLRCLTNGPMNTEAPDWLNKGTAETITYLRVELAVAEKDTEHRFYVAWDDVQAMATTLGVGIDSGFLTSGKFKRFREGTNTADSTMLERHQVEADEFVLVSNREHLPNNKRPMAALIFDKNGTKIVGVGKAQMQGHASTQSCWNSFGTNL